MVSLTLLPLLLSAGWQYPRVWFACEIRQVERQAFIIVPAVHVRFFLCVPTCNFITWLLFHSGFYCTFYYRSLVGTGVSYWGASFSCCSLPVKNRYLGGQQKLLFSVCKVWMLRWNLKDARFSLLKKLSVLLLHTHPKEVSNTVQPRQKSAWKSLQAGRFYYPNWVTHS